MKEQRQTELTNFSNEAMQKYFNQIGKVFSYRDSQEAQGWQQCILSNNVQNFSKQNIKLLTLNVLTDCTWQAPLKRGILFSEERYRFILDEIGKNDVDVVTFNQVTENFVIMLRQTQWVKKQYYISEFVHKQKQGSFNLIISRIRPLFLRKIKVDNLARPVLTFYYFIDGKFVSVSSTHLTSLQKNVQRRKKQLKNLADQLEIVGHQILHIIQGDLNIHQESETAYFKELGLEDAWLKCHSLQKNPGFTFDSQDNTMIQQVYWGFEKKENEARSSSFQGKNISQIY